MDECKPLVMGETWLVTAVSMGNPHCITFGKQGDGAWGAGGAGIKAGGSFRTILVAPKLAY